MASGAKSQHPHILPLQALEVCDPTHSTPRRFPSPSFPALRQRQPFASSTFNQFGRIPTAELVGRPGAPVGHHRVFVGAVPGARHNPGPPSEAILRYWASTDATEHTPIPYPLPDDTSSRRRPRSPGQRSPPGDGRGAGPAWRPRQPGRGYSPRCSLAASLWCSGPATNAPSPRRPCSDRPPPGSQSDGLTSPRNDDRHRSLPGQSETRVATALLRQSLVALRPGGVPRLRLHSRPIPSHLSP